jgi:mevalonate kinase
MSTTGWGRGKVILLGEHAVVYGHPALAAALDLGVSATAERVEPGRGALRVRAWELDLPATSDAPPARALRALEAALELPEAGCELEAVATVPARAGLGSSAAWAVAATRALAALARRELADEDVERIAGEAEKIFHGRPSGVDVALATRGGVGLFQRAQGLAPVAVAPFDLVIGLSGEPRDTAARVADVARRREAQPEDTDARLGRLGELAAHGAHALARGAVRTLGPLLDAAQEDLAGLGLSTPRLDAMIAAARAAGALGAKLTGAGGGGAMIALPPPAGPEAIVEALRALGAGALVVTVGVAALPSGGSPA